MNTETCPLWFDCWCYAIKDMVKIRGRIVGKRQCELLEVTECDFQSDCPKRHGAACLIGKIREGRWNTLTCR